MIDLTDTMKGKSDQLNSDALITGPITIEITNVKKTTEDQPVYISYVGDNGKPFKPCLTMRKVLGHIWGVDGAKYVGRKLTLFRDDKVVFGGMAVGGVRISHASDIDGEKTIAVMEKKGRKKPYTVLPLVEGAPKPKVDKAQAAKDKAQSIIEEITANPSSAAIVLEREKAVIERLKSGYSELHQAIMDAVPKAAPSPAAATLQAAMDEGLLDEDELPI